MIYKVVCLKCGKTTEQKADDIYHLAIILLQYNWYYVGSEQFTCSDCLR